MMDESKKEEKKTKTIEEVTTKTSQKQARPLALWEEGKRRSEYKKLQIEALRLDQWEAFVIRGGERGGKLARK